MTLAAGAVRRTSVPTATVRTWWPRVALGAILLLAAALGLVWLDREGYANPYYAAAVRSMLSDWRNFFFASFDPGGFVSVDKPPLGLWVQATTAALLGFNGVSLLLPQVLAHVGSVAVLYRFVARSFGAVAGLVAALVLAVTPISVATARNNTIDGLLVFVLLLAAWAASRAADDGRLRWLVAAMVLVGIGFNIKMLQAYLALPAVIGVYLLGAPMPWLRRAWHLGVSAVVLVAVSLSWAVAVDLTPADSRPYVGGSQTDSVLDLAIGYNGISRLLGLGDGGAIQLAPSSVPGDDGGGPPGIVGPGGIGGAGGSVAPVGAVGGPDGELGQPGPLRLFGQALAGQASWLLPFALIGLAAAVARHRLRMPLDRQQRAIVLWGGWLLGMAAGFSFASFWHPYYLVVLAPAIGALTGIGLVTMWREYRERSAGDVRRWLLPMAFGATAGIQSLFLIAYPEWAGRLTPLIVGVSALAALALVVAGLRGPIRARLALAAAAAGLAALLIAPAAWAAITVADAPGGMLPAAGPRVTDQDAFPLGQPIGLPGGDVSDEVDAGLLAYLREHREGSRYLFATTSSATAAPYIIETGEAVMAMGGFGGGDPILTVEKVADLVARGEVRFFLLDGTGLPAPGGGSGVQSGAQPGAQPPAGFPGDEVGEWIRETCREVDSAEWGGEDSGGGRSGPGTFGEREPTLYDCRGASPGRGP